MPECDVDIYMSPFLAASAKHPGGGFIRGSVAQEECLSYASGLHACLSSAAAAPFYAGKKGTLYTDRWEGLVQKSRVSMRGIPD